MSIFYKLLDDGTAIILTRQPELVEGQLAVKFNGAPPEATAVFYLDDMNFYRPLNDGRCSVPVDKFQGDIQVTVAVFDDATPMTKWCCEGLKVTRTPDGAVWIAPNDMNLPQEIANIRIRLDELRRMVETLRKSNQELEKELESIKEGYDLV